MKKFFLFLLTFTPLFFLSAVSVSATEMLGGTALQSFTKELGPVQNPIESQTEPVENNEITDIGSLSELELELPRNSTVDIEAPVANEVPDNNASENQSAEIESAEAISDFATFGDPGTVAESNTTNNVPIAAQPSESGPENEGNSNEEPDQPIVSEPEPPTTPIAQSAPVAAAPVTYRSVADPIPQRHTPLEIQLPREVFAIAQQQDYEIVLGIPEAIADNPNISSEKAALLEAEQDKQVYKIELEDLSFLCGEDSDTPATVARVKDQDELIVVLWDSEFFEKAGYDPQTRCKEASARFADFAKKNTSAYLTSGKLNNQPVICLTSSKDGDCGDGIALHEGLLFTLKPNDNPEDKVGQLASILDAEMIESSATDTTDPAKKAPENKDPLEE